MDLVHPYLRLKFYVDVVLMIFWYLLVGKFCEEWLLYERENLSNMLATSEKLIALM